MGSVIFSTEVMTLGDAVDIISKVIRIVKGSLKDTRIASRKTYYAFCQRRHERNTRVTRKQHKG